METGIFCSYDLIAMRCGTIFHAANKADAIRVFKKAYANNPERADYKLLRLGTFDHSKGIGAFEDIPEDVPFAWPKPDSGSQTPDKSIPTPSSERA